jgi:hypothetical protein
MTRWEHAGGSPERRANRVWEPAKRINDIDACGVDVMVSPKRVEGGMPIPAGE